MAYALEVIIVFQDKIYESLNLTLIYKRSFKFSRIRAQRQNHSINLGEDEVIPYTANPASPPHVFPLSQMSSDPMEFTQMHNSLNELWDRWARSKWENRVAIVDQSLVMPVNNALAFRFVSRKSIGVKDLESALNAIWRPSSLPTIYAVGEGIYVADFENVADCNRILAKQSWHLSNTLMIFKKIVGN